MRFLHSRENSPPSSEFQKFLYILPLQRKYHQCIGIATGIRDINKWVQSAHLYSSRNGIFSAGDEFQLKFYQWMKVTQFIIHFSFLLPFHLLLLLLKIYALEDDPDWQLWCWCEREREKRERKERVKYLREIILLLLLIACMRSVGVFLLLILSFLHIIFWRLLQREREGFLLMMIWLHR